MLLTEYIARTHRFRAMEELDPVYGREYLMLQNGVCYVCAWDRETETWREMQDYTIINPEGWLPNLLPAVE